MNIRLIYIHLGVVAHALGKARPHGRPGRRGAGRRSGLRPYPPLGAARSFSIVAPSPRANSPNPTPSRPLPSLPHPSLPFLGVPSYKLLFDGTVPSNNFLFDVTVPSNNHFLQGNIYISSFCFFSITKVYTYLYLVGKLLFGQAFLNGQHIIMIVCS